VLLLIVLLPMAIAAAFQMHVRLIRKVPLWILR